MHMRQATHDDVPEIISFTTDTFEWGDYVPQMIHEWIEDESGIVMVAVEDEQIVAMGRGALLTETEVWLHAARVRPSHRGRGIAGDLAELFLDWARDQGAHIARLLIEDDNEASIRHVTKMGFRRVATAVRVSRAIGEATPNADSNGNGGRQTPSTLTAHPVKAADAALLGAGWSSSPCGRPLRGLVAEGWRFHALTETDLVASARSGGLWEMGSSWAVTGPFDAAFDVALLDTTPDEAFDAIRALIDVAVKRDAEAFWMWLSDLDWLIEAAERAGCQISPNGIWVHSL